MKIQGTGGSETRGPQRNSNILLRSVYQHPSISQATTQASPRSGDLNIIKWTVRGEKKFRGTSNPQA